MPRKDSSAPNPPPPATDGPAYEEALARLEALIASLEGGAAPLAELVAKYAEGHQLLKICQEHLRAAELKVEQFHLDEDGAPDFTPFDEEK
jgi:exodeoxyribonuclease VII small subunit